MAVDKVDPAAAAQAEADFKKQKNKEMARNVLAGIGLIMLIVGLSKIV